MLGLVISLIASIPMRLKQRIPHIQIGHTLTYTSKLTVKDENLRQKRWFQLSHRELSIYVWQHSSSTCIWSIYRSQYIRYSRARGSYQDFLDRGLLLTRKLLNQGFLLVKLKSSWLAWPLWNICVANDHEYVPLVVITSWSFPRSWLINGIVTIWHKWFKV